MIKALHNIGKYILMLKKTFKRPEDYSIYKKSILKEFNDLGVNSFGIVVFISFFVGAVVALQMAISLEDNKFIPKYYIGFATRKSLILEFAPTIISIILAGKVGSYITSSIGTMRVTEQIDALDVMGINSHSFLILPKIIAALLFNPVLITISMVIGIMGGWLAGVSSGAWATEDYIIGIQKDFRPFYIMYALLKTVLFAFAIVTISSFFGYYVKGGSLAVGKASTNAVVWSSVTIIIINYMITQLFLG